MIPAESRARESFYIFVSCSGLRPTVWNWKKHQKIIREVCGDICGSKDTSNGEMGKDFPIFLSKSGPFSGGKQCAPNLSVPARIPERRLSGRSTPFSLSGASFLEKIRHKARQNVV